MGCNVTSAPSIRAPLSDAGRGRVIRLPSCVLMPPALSRSASLPRRPDAGCPGATTELSPSPLCHGAHCGFCLPVPPVVYAPDFADAYVLRWAYTWIWCVFDWRPAARAQGYSVSPCRSEQVGAVGRRGPRKGHLGHVLFAMPLVAI